VLGEEHIIGYWLKAVLLLPCRWEWNDRATSTFLFLCLLMTWGRHLLLKLGVGIVGRGFEGRVPVVLVMHSSYI